MQFRIHAALPSVAALALVSLVGFSCLATVCLSDDRDDLAAFRRLHSELRQRMDKDLAEATQFLESEIAASPDSLDLNVLRHSLASRLIEQQNWKDATAQFRKLLDFQIKHVDQSENRFGIWMTVESMQQVAAKSGSSSELKEAVDRGFEVLRAIGPEDGVEPLMPVSQLAVLKAQLMVDEGKVDQATTLVQQQWTKLSETNDSPRATEETMQALVRMLRSLTSEDRRNDSWRDDYIARLDEVVATAIDRYPTSPVLQTDFAEAQFMMITQWGQDDPEATQKRIDNVFSKLDAIATTNRSVAATLRRIEIYRERIASAKPVASLVGKPAPAWEVDAWVNAVGTSQESLKGKVVLVDFWAMWCGPCIATFPHLRQWREEFADQGFEIVGVTQYYNFVWDDENKRASRSEGDVAAEDERATLASFLEHHQLQHPVMVTPKQSKMGSEYGVRGIPHVVLIDRAGVVQLVKTGAGEATANEIHAKLKELVEATVKE